MARLLTWFTVAIAVLPFVLVAVPHSAPAHLAHAATLPPVTVTGVAVNNSSAKIDFLPVAGAADYRVIDVNNPTVVKYAGTRHLLAPPAYHFVMQHNGVTPVYPITVTFDYYGITEPQTLNITSTEIEWNALGDRHPHTLEVQAVDQEGPVPPANLYDANNNPLHQPAGMLGADAGPTNDGLVSINGQGPSTNSPHIIAQSAPFVVQANGAIQAIPSKPDAVQTFFDTFDNSEGSTIHQVGAVDPANGVMTYTLNAGTPKAWDIIFRQADTDHSMPFIMDDHFMDTLFEGKTPSSLPPGHPEAEHVTYTNMSLSPQMPADLSGGKLLHLTEEVDSHLDLTHRWLAFQLAPATDPITDFNTDNYVTDGFVNNANLRPVNHSDKALWVQILQQFCDARLYEGPTSPTNPVPVTNAFIPEFPPHAMPPCFRTTNFGGNGVGLDNRERWDLFLTTTHMALFEDGQMVVQSDIPDGGLPFTQAKLYFTHYMYATALPFEHQTLLATAPWEKFWLNIYPYSDERHWDNMGFEVLPASDVPADWHTLASLIKLPQGVPPTPAP